MKIVRDFVILPAALGLVIGLGACGSSDDDDAGGGGGGVAIDGNLSSAPTVSLERAERSLFARVVDEVVVFVKDAYAQVSGVEGVEVSAGGDSDLTDPNGSFELSGLPSGDLLVRFRQNTCDTSVPLGEVVEDSRLTLENVDFDCNSAAAERVLETFDAVVRNKPGSANGNLTVCIESAGSFRNRAVKLQGATFAGGTFETLQVGDRVELTGIREGIGTPSALAAQLVTIEGPAGGDPCAGDPTPTTTPGNGGGDPTETPDPAATETPEPTETPEATGTPEPTPTETPGAGATETPEATATETPEPTATPTQTPS